MFLINNDGAEKNFERLTSRDSFRSYDTMSTSSSFAGNPAVPKHALIKALIRDLSFWDAIPPADCKAFPNPLPQKPRIASLSSLQNADQPKLMLRRGSSVSLQDSSRSSSKATIDDQKNSGWNPQPVWKAAVDPMTGRTYYYDAVTRRTQWEKVR
jgi:WW domain